MTILEYCFNGGLWKRILKRREKMTQIKTYMSMSGGEYPKMSCITKCMNRIYNLPNPSKFDYDTKLETLSFRDITHIFIKRYVPIYKPVKRAFAKKFVIIFEQKPQLNEIDIFYMKYYNQIPHHKEENDEDEIARQGRPKANTESFSTYSYLSNCTSSILVSGKYGSQRGTVRLERGLSNSSVHSPLGSCRAIATPSHKHLNSVTKIKV